MLSRDSSIQTLLSVCIALCLLCGCDTTPSTPGRIADVQGKGGASPFEGSVVTLTGVVTGDFQNRDDDRRSDLGGFFIQDEAPDGDPATSDGVFVFEPRRGVDVRVGHRVRVTGEVTEYFGETQIIADEITVTGEGSVDATVLDLPAQGVMSNDDGELIADLERYEGMLVRTASPLTVIGTRDLEASGALLTHADGRAWQFTQRSRPDIGGYQRHREAFARRVLVVDDGRRDAGVAPIRYLYPQFGDGSGRNVRVGDRVTSLTGVIRYSRGSGEAGADNYRLMPTQEPDFEAVGDRDALSGKAPDVVRVVSFNALNFFPTIDVDGNLCGPSRLGCRGADSQAEFERQRARLISTLARLDADVVGLMEVENDARRSLETLADGLSERTGDNWSFIDTGAIGGDAIKVGLIYRVGSLQPVGRFALLDASVDPDFIDDRNRPVLAQTFASVSSGERFTVAVNHLKSKGSPCDDIGDPDRGDGQGNCNRTRTRAAAAEARWLAADPTESGDTDRLIIGDLNAYRQEDPLVALTDARYVNLLEQFVGEAAYSFVFRGESGALDHALASSSLAAQVVDVREWHINADEPRVLDYNLDDGRDPGLFDASTPWRASDHDPVIVDIRLGTEN